MQPWTRQPTFSLRDLLPGGVVSLALHVVLLLAATAWLRGCQQGMTGETGGEVFREIGIVAMDSDGRLDQPADGADPDSANEAPATPNPPEFDPSEVLPDEPPQLDQFLNRPPAESPAAAGHSDLRLPDLIGPGAPLGGLTPSGGSGLIPPAASSGAADGGSPELQPGETAFLGVADAGGSFVYVIDTSHSMGDDNRLQVAKAQLKASLRLLQPNQQFQVIFYSERPTRMKLRGQGRAMFYATATNVFLAEQQVDRVVPFHGTEHFPALLEALELKPDVIYFLTDGREPQLSPDQLTQLDRVNASTTVHVIEFSDGALTSRATSWLERLARQAGGEYREITVRQQ